MAVLYVAFVAQIIWYVGISTYIMLTVADFESSKLIEFCHSKDFLILRGASELLLLMFIIMARSI